MKIDMTAAEAHDELGAGDLRVGNIPHLHIHPLDRLAERVDGELESTGSFQVDHASLHPHSRGDYLHNLSHCHSYHFWAGGESHCSDLIELVVSSSHSLQRHPLLF